MSANVDRLFTVSTRVETAVILPLDGLPAGLRYKVRVACGPDRHGFIALFNDNLSLADCQAYLQTPGLASTLLMMSPQFLPPSPFIPLPNERLTVHLNPGTEFLPYATTLYIRGEPPP